MKDHEFMDKRTKILEEESKENEKLKKKKEEEDKLKEEQTQKEKRDQINKFWKSKKSDLNERGSKKPDVIQNIKVDNAQSKVDKNVKMDNKSFKADKNIKMDNAQSKADSNEKKAQTFKEFNQKEVEKHQEDFKTVKDNREKKV